MRGKIKVLILDDDESILETLSESLEMKGFEVATGLDGDEGLRKLNAFRPDYVVVDCLMPRVDGVQFCTKMKENAAHSHIKIIMMSAVFTDTLLEAAESGILAVATRCYVSYGICRPQRSTNISDVSQQGRLESWR